MNESENTTKTKCFITGTRILKSGVNPNFHHE